MITMYAAVTVYVAHSDQNRDWALRVLTEGVEELLAVHNITPCRYCHVARQSPKSATYPAAHVQAQGPADIATDPVNTIYEKLARTQALWMYQVLRVFDGDIGLRAQAEQDMNTLETWLLELEQYRDNLEEMCLLDEAGVRQRAPRSWEVCILAPLITILMTISTDMNLAASELDLKRVPPAHHPYGLLLYCFLRITQVVRFQEHQHA